MAARLKLHRRNISPPAIYRFKASASCPISNSSPATSNPTHSASWKVKELAAKARSNNPYTAIKRRREPLHNLYIIYIVKTSTTKNAPKNSDFQNSISVRPKIIHPTTKSTSPAVTSLKPNLTTPQKSSCNRHHSSKNNTTIISNRSPSLSKNSASIGHLLTPIAIDLNGV